MKYPTSILTAVAMLLALGIGSLAFWPRADIFPLDSTSARQALLQSLGRQHKSVDGAILEISTADSWVSNLWVFAIRNPRYELMGGPVYENLFLVGPSVNVSRGGPSKSLYVTEDLSRTFADRLYHLPPKSETGALQVATCFAWLATQTHPTNLVVLTQVPDAVRHTSALAPRLIASIEKEITPPQVTVHGRTHRHKPIYTVEMTTYSPDFWGDVSFWHFEIGQSVFSVSKRPVYLAPRVLE